MQITARSFTVEFTSNAVYLDRSDGSLVHLVLKDPMIVPPASHRRFTSVVTESGERQLFVGRHPRLSLAPAMKEAVAV